MKKKLSNFWYYYKWYILFALLVLWAVFGFLNQFQGNVEPDASVSFVTMQEIPEDVQKSLHGLLSEMAGDRNGDGKVEMTIYMTPDNLASNSILSTIKNVYVGVFTQVTDSGGKTTWEQLGDLYHGTAQCNDYDSNIFNGFDRSINTDRWRSSQAYHGVKSNSTIENVIKGYKNSK